MTEPTAKPAPEPSTGDPESYLVQRAARADILEALEILKRAGVGNPTEKGDEIPDF